jgi:NACalpha-BTF3-like transcription factor
MTVPIKAPAVAAPIRRVVLNTAKKAEAIAFWKAGTMTLEELSKKYKVNVRTLSRLFERVGAKKNDTGDITKKIVETAVENSLINDANIYAQRVKDTKEEHYKMATTLAKLIYAKVITQQKENKAMGAIAGDIKTLHLAIMAIKVSREERYATLGIHADDVAEDRPLPDLIVQELTAEDIREMSKDNMVTDDDLDLDGDMGDQDMIEREEQNDKVSID